MAEKLKKEKAAEETKQFKMPKILLLKSATEDDLSILNKFVAQKYNSSAALSDRKPAIPHKLSPINKPKQA